MPLLSARATRTAVIVVALSGASLWALHAMDARADPPAQDDSSPCAEGRALFAAKLAYLEARISPEPSQEDAWRRFADAMRASAGEADRACAEEPPRPLAVDAGERLKRMERHAAAMQAMFGAMANAYVAIVPNLTAAQRDILSRNIIPPFAAHLPGGFAGRAGDVAQSCGQREPGSHGSAPPWGAPPL
ncbi:MAG TPA: Spy/CpxP family protein refolding chaperone [Roseiarcus sp.]